MLILASQSPRRQDLLRQAGFGFRVVVPGVDERRLPEEPPESYVERLARAKAEAVEAGPEDWVLAADTTVALDHHVLEKPADAAEAARMLRLLSGRVHEVMTGVCLRHGGRQWSGVETTRVEFAELSEEEIAEYAASGEPLDKAGGYGIQGRASKLIPRIEGCYFNVVGLPVARVYAMLRAAGYHLPRG